MKKSAIRQFIIGSSVLIIFLIAAIVMRYAIPQSGRDASGLTHEFQPEWFERSGDALVCDFRQTTPANLYAIFDLAVSDDGQSVAVAAGGYRGSGLPSQITVWNTATGLRDRLWKEPDEQSTALAWLNDTALMACDTHGRVNLLKPSSGEKEHRLQMFDRSTWHNLYSESPHAIVPFQDAKRVAVSLSQSNGDHAWQSIYIYDLPRAEKDFSLKDVVPEYKSGGFALSRDGTCLAVGSIRRGILVISTATNQLLHQLPEAGGPSAFSPDGKQLACTGGKQVGAGYLCNVTIWDIATKQRTEFPLRPERILTVIGYTPDGRTVVSAADDGTIRFWDVPTRTEIRTIPGVPLTDELKAQLGNEVRSYTSVPLTKAKLSANGKTLVAAYRDGTVRIWDVPKLLPARPN